MKIPVIKTLVDTYTKEELELAEEALINEMPTSIKIEGDDEGEQLTHVLAALWITNEMQISGLDFTTLNF